MLAKRLELRGIDADYVHSGEDAILKIGKSSYDVAILDVKMPGMDGIAILKEIKKSFPLVEVIMLTGHGTTESAVQGMKLGAFDYLLKPAHFDDLTAKLEAARQRKDEQEERVRKAEAKLLLRKSGNI